VLAYVDMSIVALVTIFSYPLCLAYTYAGIFLNLVEAISSSSFASTSRIS